MAQRAIRVEHSLLKKFPIPQYQKPKGGPKGFFASILTRNIN